jgi:hypothetical protein
MTRIADDFAAIRARLAQLRHEPLLFREDELVTVSIFRVEAALDADFPATDLDEVLGIDCG